MAEDILFKVLTPLGFWVHATQSRWNLIVTIKHQTMSGREAEVQDTLRDPDEIRRSRSDPDVCLFYRRERPGRWICAVAKRAGDGGFLITAYPTDAIKEGEWLWNR